MAGLLTAWFGLTLSERRVVSLILFLALAGLAGKYWHLKSEQAKPYVPERPAVQFRHEPRQPAGTNLSHQAWSDKGPASLSLRSSRAEANGADRSSGAPPSGGPAAEQEEKTP